MVQKNVCTNVDVEAVTGCIAEQATREISGRGNKNLFIFQSTAVQNYVIVYIE